MGPGAERPRVAWTREIDALLSFFPDDGGEDVAVTQSGDILIAGYASVDGAGIDVWARRLSPDGDEIRWTLGHSGPGGFPDFGLGIAPGPGDSTYLCGYETTHASNVNYWLRRVDADGEEIFTHTGFVANTDHARDVATMPDGGAVVVGFETTFDAGRNSFLRRFSPSGELLWTRMHAGPGGGDDELAAVTTDCDGNIYVAGFESVLAQGADIWIARYDAEGERQWARSHHEGGRLLDDEAHDIALGPDGNIYVSGGIDVSGVSGQGSDAWLRKLSPEGATLWTRSHNGPQREEDVALGVVVDGAGNAYVAGAETGPNHDQRIWVRAYSSSGDVLWTELHNGPGPAATDRATGIALAPNGDLLVIGTETTSFGTTDIWLRRYEK